MAEVRRQAAAVPLPPVSFLSCSTSPSFTHCTSDGLRHRSSCSRAECPSDSAFQCWFLCRSIYVFESTEAVTASPCCVSSFQNNPRLILPGLFKGYASICCCKAFRGTLAISSFGPVQERDKRNHKAIFEHVGKC